MKYYETVFELLAKQFEIAGSNVDFVTDLGFEPTRFKDLRIVLRPTRFLGYGGRGWDRAGALAT